MTLASLKCLKFVLVYLLDYTEEESLKIIDKKIYDQNRRVRMANRKTS